jgi:hypothetical protein
MLACVNASNHRKSTCDSNICVEAIGVDQIFKAIDAIMTALPKTIVEPLVRR